MKAFKIALIIATLSLSISAQNIGEWKIYSNMKSIQNTVLSNNSIWAATSGGVFKFNKDDSTYTKFSKADGLNSQNVTAIALDENQNIWVGTGEGYINIINSKDFSIEKIVDIYNTNKGKKQVNDIYIKGDSVFVATDFGLIVISSSKHTLLDSYLKFGNFNAETRVLNTIKIGKIIYVSTESGVAIQKTDAQNLAAPESWNNFYINSTLPASSVYNFAILNSELLISSSNGILKYSNNSWQKSSYGNSRNILALSVYNNNLYFITADSLFQYVNSSISSLYSNKDYSFSNLSIYSNGIYISTDKGIIEISSNKIRNLLPNCPSSNTFLNLSVSPNGTLWVATGKDVGGKGFFEFDGEKWKSFDKATYYPSLTTDGIYNVYAGSDSTIYFGTWGYGALLFKNNTFTFFNTANSGMAGIPNDENFLVISDIKLDSKGNAWFVNPLSSTGKPLSVYTTSKKWYHYSFYNPTITTNDFLDKMVIDQYDTKWFFAIQGTRGLYYFNDKGTYDNITDDTQGYLGESDGLTSNIISCLAVDLRGAIWIGTDVGVNMIYDPSKPKSTLTTNVGLAVRNQSVNCIAVDPINQKWIGTNNGIFVLSSDGYSLIKQYHSKNSPLPDDNIMSITFDAKKGIVYIGTDYGLASLNTEFVEPKESFDDLFIYPNPFVLDGADDKKITINGLVANCSIKVLKITGELVTEFDSPGGRIAFWDGKDKNGNLVASGVYYIVAYDSEANNISSAKVAIIRK